MKSRVKLLSLLFILTLVVSSCWLPPQKQHVILFISDGTQLEHYIATSRYLFGKDDGLVFQKGFDYEGYTTTWDVTTYNKYAAELTVPNYDPASFNPIVGYDPSLGGWAPYPICELPTQNAYFDLPYATIKCTDSASSATAIFTGNKTLTKVINYDYTKTTKLTNIAELLRAQKGFAIGTCSTVPFTHATPAAFVAHNKARDVYYELADEIINVIKPEVVIGGGWPNPEIPAKPGPYLYVSADQVTTLTNSTEYQFVQRTAGVNGRNALLAAAKGAVKTNKKLFGLFGGVNLDAICSHHIDAPIPSDGLGYPSFTYATDENPNLADIVESAIKVLKQDEDGFIVMFEAGDVDWANHYSDYKWMIGATAQFNLAVWKAIAMVNMPGDDMDWSNTTLIVTSDHANGYLRLTDNPKLGVGDLPEQNLVDGKYQYPGGELTYGQASYHTNEPVMLYAKGNKARTFKKYENQVYPGLKLIDNTDIFEALKEITGVDEE